MQQETQEYWRRDRELLARPGVSASYPFAPDLRVYKVLHKVFALIAEGEAPLRISLKGDPIRNEFLCRDFPAITPGYHLNKRHWITVILDDSVPAELIDDLVSDSYERVRDGMTRAERIRLASLDTAD